MLCKPDSKCCFRCEGARKIAGSRDEDYQREGLLATHGDFYNQPVVADAASELLRDVFGEDKMPVRSVLGVTALPLGAPVMVEVTFEIENKEDGS
jgi:enamine deaminase RidA (YjgF/YER057c/UK114 family)